MRTIPLGSRIPSDTLEAFLRVDGILLIEKIEDYNKAPNDIQTARTTRLSQTSAQYVAALEAKAAKYAADSETASQYAKLQALAVMSPSEVQTWVTTNVTSLAQAQDAITTLAIAVSVLSRQFIDTQSARSFDNSVQAREAPTLWQRTVTATKSVFTRKGKSS